MAPWLRTVAALAEDPVGVSGLRQRLSAFCEQWLLWQRTQLESQDSDNGFQPSVTPVSGMQHFPLVSVGTRHESGTQTQIWMLYMN